MTRPSRRMPPSGRSLLRPLQALRTFKRRVGTQRPETDRRVGPRNFASGPFPSPLTTTSVRTQQRKVI